MGSNSCLPEVEDPEPGELVDDEEPVVGLGHDGVVEEGEQLDGLDRGERLDVGQLLDVVVGQDEAVQVREVLLKVLADAAAKRGENEI